MANKLQEIVAHKLTEVEIRKSKVPFDSLLDQLPTVDPVRGFADAIDSFQTGSIAVIAEVKRASPSKGILTKKFGIENIVHEYKLGGASALSVLTDEKYFKGNDEHLLIAHNTVSLPIIRKEFIIDEYQIYESRILQADAILLIAAVLSNDQLLRMVSAARDLHLDVLVECHDHEEILRAVDCGAEIIGINNRDLNTFEVSINTSFHLKRFIPNHCIAVSESGIRNNHQLRRLQEEGFDAVLVGEQLITQNDRREALLQLRGQSSDR